MKSSESFVKKILEWEPWLDRSAKSELKALAELLNLFPQLSLNELVAELKKYQKARRLSPEGFCDRVQEYLAVQDRDPAVSEQLVRDFAQLAAATVKVVARRFDLNVSSAKNDAGLFETWLIQGIKPPTKEVLYREKLIALAQEVLHMRDEIPGQLERDTINSIMDIAEDVKKKYKLAGLREFLRLIDYPPVKANDSGTTMIKMLRQKLDDLSIDRYKAHQIESQV